MNRTCAAPGCDNPAPDAFICNNDIDQLRRDLRTLAGTSERPGLIDELVTSMARLDRIEPDSADPVPWDSSEDDEPARDDEPIATTTLPYRVPAAETLRNLHADLVTWVRHLVEARFGPDLDGYHADQAYVRAAARPGEAGRHLLGAVHGPWRWRPQLPPNDTRELAAWLGRYLETIRQDEAAGELVADVARHTSRARLVVFPRAVEYLGACTCPTLLCGCDTPERCGRPHWLPLVDLYIPAGDETVTCPRCGMTEQTAPRRERLLEECRDQLVTAADGSRALVEFVRKVRGPEGKAFTAAAIRGMGHRGRLTVYAGGQADAQEDENAERDTSTLYKVGELMDLVRDLAAEQKTREQRARRRRDTKTSA